MSYFNVTKSEINNVMADVLGEVIISGFPIINYLGLSAWFHTLFSDVTSTAPGAAPWLYVMTLQ